MNYFAYGSNMDVRQMAFRCPDAVIIGSASLAAHAFLINTRGVATAIPATNQVVHGVLWEISPTDESSLDRYEGVVSGFYNKDIARVRVKEGSEKDALIYLASDVRPGQPRHGYMERILEAAEYCRLPKTYIAALRERWGGQKQGERANCGHALGDQHNALDGVVWSVQSLGQS